MNTEINGIQQDRISCQRIYLNLSDFSLLITSVFLLHIMVYQNLMSCIGMKDFIKFLIDFCNFSLTHSLEC